VAGSNFKRRKEMELHEEIEMIAYELWEQTGRIHGRDLEHWFEAERIVKERYELETPAKKKPQEKKPVKSGKKKGVKTQKRKTSEES
jgi:hypothetical protein